MKTWRISADEWHQALLLLGVTVVAAFGVNLGLILLCALAWSIAQRWKPTKRGESVWRYYAAQAAAFCGLVIMIRLIAAGAKLIWHFVSN